MSDIRTALSSDEEQWVILCYKFFEEHGFCDWYMIPKDKAFRFIMTLGKGHLNPKFIQNKLDILYDSVGI